MPRICRALLAVFREMREMVAIATQAEFNGQPEFGAPAMVVAKRAKPADLCWMPPLATDIVTPGLPSQTDVPFSFWVEIPEQGIALIPVPQETFRRVTEGEEVTVSYRVGKYSGDISARLA